MGIVSKQMEPTVQPIGGNTFYIYPFPAFVSANLSGEITALLIPMVTSIAAAVAMGDNKEKSIMDMEISEVAPYITGAFSTLSGDKVERLLRKLLLANNVGVLREGEADAQWLTENICDTLFCGSTQDMFILAFYVIKVNYSGFFEKLENLPGSVKEALQKKMGTEFPGMAPLM